MTTIDSLLERGWLPDTLIRAGIRRLIRIRLQQESRGDAASRQERLMRLIAQLKDSPIAVCTSDANDQHYELPPEFFELILGDHLKYSSGYWRNGTSDLNTAEKEMLNLTAERAQIADGQSVLDLGCGWGSFTLFAARKYPRTSITAVSNSTVQGEYIRQKAARLGLRNIAVITADMNTFETGETFDRIVSVEMFEHMRNYEQLMRKCFRFLNPGGKLFLHIFTHREHAYPFLVEDSTDWMAKYFFTGGTMPSDHLMLYFAGQFSIEGHWRVGGGHYKKTAEAWLQKMETNRVAILQIFSRHYGPENARKWWNYWKVFFMACSELWGYRDGNEWFVSHYLFGKAS